MTTPFVFTSQQGNSEELQTALGSSTLAGKSALPSGGLVFPSVANLAALTALSTVGLGQGALAYVQSVGAYWGLQPPGGATVDGITVVNASNGGLWYRIETGIAEASTQRTSWNVNGATGNDENDGTVLHPLATFQEVSRRMGTWEPVINGIDVVIHADQIQSTDYLNFLPSGTGSLTVLFPTNPSQQVFAGVLAGVTAKNTATGAPLQATAWGGAAIGQLVINATRGNSVAKVVDTAGGVVTFSQPLQSVAVPPASTPNPVEVDTWANGDSVTAFTLISCRVLRHGYVLNTFGPGSFASWLYRCNLAAPADLEQTTITDLGNLVECTWEGTLNCYASNVNITLQNCSPSVDAGTGGGAILGGSPAAAIGQVVIQGGAAHSISLQTEQTSNAPELSLGFAILSSIAPSSLSGVILDDVRVALDVVVRAIGLPVQVKTFVWGQGSMDLQSGTVRCVGPATATLLLTGGVTLDGLGVAFALSSSAGVVTWSGPRSVTVANLDTAVGGGGFTDASAFGVSGFTALNGRSVLTNQAA